MRYILWVLCSAMLLYCYTANAALYGKRYCKQPGYHCITVKRNQTWHSLWPNAEERDIVMRLNRLNITYLYPGMTLAVPDDLANSHLMQLAPLPLHLDTTEKLVIFDPRELAWGAYDDEGYLVRWGPASGGANWCKDIESECRTHSGEFRAYSLGSSRCFSSKFPLPDGGAPMPYCIFFNGGQAFHGEPNGVLGYNASHGCIRTFVNDAEWLRYNFIEGPSERNNFRGTKIIVLPYEARKVSAENNNEVVSSPYATETAIEMR